jgi:hypothetical protein
MLKKIGSDRLSRGFENNLEKAGRLGYLPPKKLARWERAVSIAPSARSTATVTHLYMSSKRIMIKE